MHTKDFAYEQTKALCFFSFQLYNWVKFTNQENKSRVLPRKELDTYFSYFNPGQKTYSMVNLLWNNCRDRQPIVGNILRNRTLNR